MHAGREHDSPCLLGSGIRQQLQQAAQRSGRSWAVFGDSAFGLDRHVHRMLRGAAKHTVAGRRYNRYMSKARVAVENAFAELLNRWGFVGHKRLNKLGSMPVAKHVKVAVMLHNCEAICYGNQATAMFGDDHLREKLTIGSYLARAFA